MSGLAAGVAIAGGVAAAGTLGSAYMGNQAAGEANAAARQKEEQALAVWDELKTQLPTITPTRVELDKLKSAGLLTPEQEEVILAKPSAFEDIAVDQRLKDAQMRALDNLSDISDDGMTIEDRAAMAEIKSDLNNEEKAGREAILQNAAQKGTLSGGMVVADQLLNAQRTADRGSLEGFKVGADARKRALEAISAEGTLAGNMRTQDFGEQSKVADARDAINKFNTQQSSDVQQRNVAGRNAAQQYNLSNDQRIMDTNVGLSNQQTITNSNASNTANQANFNNAQSIAAGKTGQLNTMAQGDRTSGEQSAAMWSGVGQGINKIGTGAMDYALSQNKGSTGTTDLDSDKLVKSSKFDDPTKGIA